MLRFRRYLLPMVYALVSALTTFISAPALAAEDGTVGMTVQQLYSQREVSHRGNLGANHEAPLLCAGL